MSELLKGAPVSAALTDELVRRTERLKNNNIMPTLAIVRIGEKPDDVSYESGIVKRADKIGIRVRKFVFPADCKKEALLAAIREINDDASIHGCLVFRPLPDRALESEVCDLLSPLKDIDGMTASSLASLFVGRGVGYPPCTAQSCMEILDYYGIDLTGARATVVGRSLVIGKPISMMLQARNATVTMCHTRTKDLALECQNAEILLVAIGQPGSIGKDYVKPGQIVIDIGINVDENGKLCGDTNFEEIADIVTAITPVPGGVGSVTTAVLCKHVIQSAEMLINEQ